MRYIIEELGLQKKCKQRSGVTRFRGRPGNRERECLKSTGITRSGVKAGKCYQLTAYGIWGFALIASPTLRSALELALRYLDLSYAFTRLKLLEHGSEAQK